MFMQILQIEPCVKVSTGLRLVPVRLKDAEGCQEKAEHPRIPIREQISDLAKLRLRR